MVIEIPPTEALLEEGSYSYVQTCRTQAGALLQSADVTAILLTVQDLESGDIVNLRNGANVFGGIATVSNGTLTIVFVPNDFPAIGDTLFQLRRMTIIIQLTAGGQAPIEVHYYVRNLGNVT